MRRMLVGVIASIVPIVLVSPVCGEEQAVPVPRQEPTAPPAATAGSDWNQWRGPNRNGVAPDSPKLADEWGKDGPELLWKSEPITEGGFGSPVVVNGKVYLFVNWKLYKGQGRAADLIVCLDANTGATLWQTDFPGRQSGWGASSTPCVFDGRLWAVGSNGMYCLDAATGREIWKVPSVGELLSSSPTLVNGVIVVSVPNLKGFEAVTGKELWACPQAGHGTGQNTSPAVWENAQRQYVITNMGKLTCVNPTDGAVVWQGEAADGNSTPSITGNTCLVGSAVAGYKLAPDKGSKLFDTRLRDRGASQILYNGYVFAFSGGAIRCLDLTGKQLWELGVGGEISSPVLADGKIFLVCSDDKLVMARATPEKPAKCYEARIPALGCTSPAVWDGKLFVRLKAAVGCYDLTKSPMESGNAPPRPPETPKDVVPGLKVAYYEGEDLRWPRIGGVPEKDAYYAGGDFSVVLNLGQADPVKTGTAAGIDLAFAVAKEEFGLKFTGYVEVPEDGTYTFYTNSDGGSRLFIGKTPVVDNDGLHGLKEESGSIRLEAGKHALTVYYIQGGGGAALSASYEGPGIPKGSIPANVLWRDAPIVQSVREARCSRVRTEAGPEIDGRLDDRDWKDCHPVADFVLPNGEELSKYPTEARLAYDRANLYLRFRCREEDLTGLRAQAKDRDGSVFTDDSVEVFLDTHLDHKTYYHFGFNCQAVVYDAVVFDSSWNGPCQARAGREENAWTVEVAIPWKSIGMESPKPGDRIGLELVRTHAWEPREMSQWAPTQGGNHAPSRFGILVFE